MVALRRKLRTTTPSISANHRGGDAACAVWKALWKARERRNNQEAQEKGGTLPAFDGFCVADAVLYTVTARQQNGSFPME